MRVCYQLQNWPLPPSRSPTRVPWGVGADGWADGRLLPPPSLYANRRGEGEGATIHFLAFIFSFYSGRTQQEGEEFGG